MEAIIITNEHFKKLIEKIENLSELVENKLNIKPDLEKTWLDNEEVMNLLKVSSRTLQNYRDNGTLSFSQFGNKIYYKASDIQKHLEKNYKQAFKK